MSKAKIVDTMLQLKELFDPRTRWGFTCGTFDILHAGHVEFLQQAYQRCDRLIVAVNSDASVKRYKGWVPVVPLQQRMEVVAGLSSVDFVLPLENDTPRELLLSLKPEFYFKGGDYTPERLASAATVDGYGGKVECIPTRYPELHSRLIKRAILAQDLAQDK